MTTWSKLTKTQGFTVKLPRSDGERAADQYIVPHETRKMNGDPHAMDGEYRYIHLCAGGERWPSSRHYFGEMVVALEAEVQIRSQLADLDNCV